MEKKFEYIENMSDKLLVKCYCPNEKKIVVEDGVTIIGPSVFQCSSAEEIILPNSVEKIYDKAFLYCKNLKRITIGGNNLRKIGAWVLDGCTNLQEISFISALEEEVFRAFSDLVNSSIKTYYFMNADKAVSKMEQVFTKKRRIMTLKISAGKKEIVVPRYVDSTSCTLLKKIAFNALLEGPDRRVPKEDIAFDGNGWTLDEFLTNNVSNTRCRFLAAMEFYFLEKDKSALHYLESHTANVYQMLAEEKNDYLLTEFVKMDIMDEKGLNYAMQVAIDNGLTTSTVYILNFLDKKKKRKFQI